MDTHKISKNKAFTTYSENFDEYYELCMKDFVRIFNEVEREALENTRPDLKPIEINEYLMKSLVSIMLREFKSYSQDNTKPKNELFTEWCVRKKKERNEKFNLETKESDRL